MKFCEFTTIVMSTIHMICPKQSFLFCFIVHINICFACNFAVSTDFIKNALMICDEVRTGFGPTGSLFACSSSYYGDIRPDILTMAKGIASGFQLSAVAMRSDVSDSCNPGMLGGT